jgi:hypothetical protein
LEIAKTREIPCCYSTEWSKVGGEPEGDCNINGKQEWTRQLVGACDAVPTEDDKVLCDSELARLKNIPGKEGVKGVRYVWFGFDNDKETWLNIAEIEIYSGGENIVKNWDQEPEKLEGVTVSSISDWQGGVLDQSKLFDGEKTGNSMFHSEFGKGNYFKIDLGKEYTIEEVKVFNRGQCNACNDRWEGAVLKLLDSSENVLKTGEAITAADTDISIYEPYEIHGPKIYNFTISPDTLAKLEEVMDVVPADFSEISDSQWRKTIPACEFTSFADESHTYKEEPCQYVGEWSPVWGACNGTTQYKTRDVKNAYITEHAAEFDAAILNPTTSKSMPCSPCKGEWRKNYGNESALRMNRVRHDRHKRQVWTQYYQTKAASGNGDNNCPAVGTRKDAYEQRRKNGDFDWTQHVVETVVGG